jgi:hypothetical protein
MFAITFSDAYYKKTKNKICIHSFKKCLRVIFLPIGTVTLKGGLCRKYHFYLKSQAMTSFKDASRKLPIHKILLLRTCSKPYFGV